MTDRPAPTDAELDALCIEISDYDDAAYFRHMARTVLARFGTPPPTVAREPDTPEFVALSQFIMACKDQQMNGAALLDAMRWLVQKESP